VVAAIDKIPSFSSLPGLRSVRAMVEKLIRPGDGRKFLSGSSTLIRNPVLDRGPLIVMSACANSRGRPSADRYGGTYKIDPSDHFHHRMLDLNAGIHFDVEEFAAVSS
jgi:hypothetical protein